MPFADPFDPLEALFDPHKASSGPKKGVEEEEPQSPKEEKERLCTTGYLDASSNSVSSVSFNRPRIDPPMSTSSMARSSYSNPTTPPTSLVEALEKKDLLKRLRGALFKMGLTGLLTISPKLAPIDLKGFRLSA